MDMCRRACYRSGEFAINGAQMTQGLTYAQAGVDIDAGNELVERIKPASKSTQRSGSMSGLGGFGAMFDPKAAGYDDPILVGATDGSAPSCVWQLIRVMCQRLALILWPCASTT